MTKVKPTMADLQNPYVLQLIEVIARLEDSLEAAVDVSNTRNEKIKLLVERIAELESTTVTTEYHDHIVNEALVEIERLTNRVNDRDCEIERLRVFAKKGPYDESAATRAMLLQAECERLRAALQHTSACNNERLRLAGIHCDVCDKISEAALREDENE